MKDKAGAAANYKPTAALQHGAMRWSRTAESRPVLSQYETLKRRVIINRHLFNAGMIFTAALLVAAAAPGTGAPKYFISDSHLGSLNTSNNQPGQAVFYSGKYNRTYVLYMSDRFMAKITYYDHDTKRWAEPAQVDDVRFSDGHNNPEIFITKDGYLHLFYGCHYNSVKYARSLYPEDISRWRLGQEIGSQATYPHPVQLNNGDLLLFYRWYSAPEHPLREHGFSAPLTVIRSTDNGRTWDGGTEIARVHDHARNYLARCYIGNIVYDSQENMVYLPLYDVCIYSPEGKQPSVPYNVKYDPVTRHVLSLDGADMGVLATKDELIANGCAGKRGSPAFVPWGDSRVLKVMPPASAAGEVYPADGVNLRRYNVRSAAPKTDFKGYDRAVWRSNDGGLTWDEGETLFDRHEFGEGVYHLNINVVRNYPGNGPLLIFQTYGGQPTAEFMVRYAARTKYAIEPILMPWRAQPWSWGGDDVPMRKGKHIYALDGDHQFVTN